MEKVASKVAGSAILVEYPDGRKALFGTFELHCPACGDFRFSLPGHHFRQIRDLLTQWCDLYPDMVGGEVTLREEAHAVIVGPPGGDPQMN